MLASTVRKVLAMFVLLSLCSFLLVIYVINNSPSCSVDNFNPYKLIKSMQDAENGDLEDAVFLYEHFSFCMNSDSRIYWLEKAANHGSLKHQLIYADILEKNGDRDSAIKLLNKLADDGNKRAINKIAGFYQQQGDDSSAYKYYILTAKEGDVGAMLQAGKVLLSDDRLDPVNDARYWVDMALKHAKPGSAYEAEARALLLKILH